MRIFVMIKLLLLVENWKKAIIRYAVLFSTVGTLLLPLCAIKSDKENIFWH